MLGQHLNIGQLLDGRYRITQALPPGGFGLTYIAEDIKRPGNPPCVVKQLWPLRNDPSTLQISRRLFKTEAETLERLGHHDRIPRLFAYFEDNQEFYLVQEFIPGQTLDKILLLGKPLPSDQVINLLTQVLEILVFVHDQQVIHRDIKPSNLIRRQTDDKIVLIDFGAVKEVVSQTLNTPGQASATVSIGTPDYMPLEQLQGNPQFNSDIYALGMVGIQALTGLPANDISKLRDPNNPNMGEIVWTHRASHTNPQLVNVLNKMVSFDCRQRYQSASEVLKVLTNLGGNDIIQNPTQTEPLRLLLAGAATLIVVGVTYAFYAFYLQKPINKPTDAQALKTVVEKANKGEYQKSAPSVLPQQSLQELQINGQQINDTLGKDDSVLPPNNRYYKLYKFPGQAGQVLTIEMKSQSIDPALILLNADGSELARNDGISPSDFNSRIVATLPKDGIYIVLATTSFGDTKQSGAYSLKAKVSK